MDTVEHLHHFAAEHHAFVAACHRAGVQTVVPSCPGWTVADLLYHVYEVQYGWHRVTAERLKGFELISLPARPTDETLAAVVAGEHAAYAAVLGAFDPSTPIWTWAGLQDMAWLARRMAHELAVHRVDAEMAAGEVALVPELLASDGIDEFLTYFVNTRGGEVGGSVHLHCTDVPGEWTLRPDGDGFVVAREHAKGDCAIRGGASEILMALWRRGPLDACDVMGDADVAVRFIAASRLE